MVLDTRVFLHELSANDVRLRVVPVELLDVLLEKLVEELGSSQLLQPLHLFVD